MRNSFKLILSILTLVFVLGSCSKYEQGPGLSLLTKKARLTGYWIAESKTTESGVVTFYTEEKTFNLNKDESFQRDSELITFLEVGTWTFSNEKGSIVLTYKKNGNNYVEELEIIRLKNDELWLRNSGGDQINYKSE